MEWFKRFLQSKYFCIDLVEANIVNGILFPFYDQMYSVLLPIAIFILFYIRWSDVYDLHHSILGNHILQSLFN